jgi:hypothetical protein
VIIASSTSGLLPSRLQSGMAHPGRFVVGHPFNPVYLMPLVEICGGDKTSAATKAGAAAFYRSLGMKPLLVRKEIDGFIADRLMEALGVPVVSTTMSRRPPKSTTRSASVGPLGFMHLLIYRTLAAGARAISLAHPGPTPNGRTKLMDVPSMPRSEDRPQSTLRPETIDPSLDGCATTVSSRCCKDCGRDRRRRCSRHEETLREGA